MARPARNASPENIVSCARTFFATTKTAQGSALLQSERNAMLMIDVLRSYVVAGKFRLHDFVVMPNHLHLLLTVGQGMTIEKAMQFVKGGFSFRAKKELVSNAEIWQRGFSDHRIRDCEDYERHVQYIRMNPVKGRLCERAEQYKYSSAFPGWKLDPIPQGLKPGASLGASGGTAEAVPFQNKSDQAGGSDKSVPFQDTNTRI